MQQNLIVRFPFLLCFTISLKNPTGYLLFSSHFFSLTTFRGHSWYRKKMQIMKFSEKYKIILYKTKSYTLQRRVKINPLPKSNVPLLMQEIIKSILRGWIIPSSPRVAFPIDFHPSVRKDKGIRTKTSLGRPVQFNTKSLKKRLQTLWKIFT